MGLGSVVVAMVIMVRILVVDGGAGAERHCGVMDSLLEELSVSAREYQYLDARMKSEEVRSAPFRERVPVRRSRRLASRRAVRLAAKAVNQGYSREEISEAVMPRVADVAAWGRSSE